jgi:ketosteroid isomerase-like protein
MNRETLLVLTSAITTLTGCAGTRPAILSPRAVVEAKFAAVNRHSVSDIVKFYSADAVIIAPDFCQPRRGQSDVTRIYESLFGAYPDIAADVHEYVVQGDRVVVRMTVSSRLPGHSFDVPIADFLTVRNGLIVSDDGYFDKRGRPCSP